MENFDSNFDFAVCDACNDAMTPQEVSEKNCRHHQGEVQFRNLC